MKHTLLALIACLLVLPFADAQKTTTKQTKSKKQDEKPTYYYNNDGTMTEKSEEKKTDAKRPSAYKGDNVPENDGQKKNQQRNMNYNSSQPMPSSSGK